jgi:hypothetical protein
MSPTDPSTNDHGGTDTLEARLRHALIVVADSNPVADPVPSAAPMPLLKASDRSGDRSRPLWRIVAAAAVLVAVIGGAAVVGGQRDRARVDLTPADGGPEPTTEPTTGAAPVSPDFRLQDHWHEAYGVYVCDTFLPPVSDAKEDVLGIHTHGDGIVHIHPFDAASSGTNATLGLFGDQVGITFSADGWRLPNGDSYRAGSASCGGQPATVAVYRWSVDESNVPGDVPPAEVHTEDFGAIVFGADRQAYTIAVVPEGTTPPRPPSVPTLDNLTDVAPTTAPEAVPN